MNHALGIFVKNLRFGKVKTRLAAGVGDAGAINIYKILLQHTCFICSPLGTDKYVFYSDSLEEQDIWDETLFYKQLQQAGDLGIRVQHAFAMLFEKGYEKVVIIGSDCMELTGVIINKAFTMLSENDVVIGPALDGGYYLLGLKKIHPVLFTGIAWSTDQVFAQTLKICDENQLSYGLLQTLSDIDDEEDWLRYIRTSTSKAPSG